MGIQPFIFAVGIAYLLAVVSFAIVPALRARDAIRPSANTRAGAVT